MYCYPSDNKFRGYEVEAVLYILYELHGSYIAKIPFVLQAMFLLERVA